MVLDLPPEHNLPLAVANHILELVNEMIQDLRPAKTDRTTAWHYLQFGLAKELHEELIKKFNQRISGLNLGETISVIHYRLLTILISYFVTLKERNLLTIELL